MIAPLPKNQCAGSRDPGARHLDQYSVCGLDEEVMAGQGGLAMKSNNYLVSLSILFFVLAVAFSLVFWADVSLVAKVGLFVLGFGSGVTAGQWFARRSA